MRFRSYTLDRCFLTHQIKSYNNFKFSRDVLILPQLDPNVVQLLLSIDLVRKPPIPHTVATLTSPMHTPKRQLEFSLPILLIPKPYILPASQ
jgi:hypothetical protein